MVLAPAHWPASAPPADVPASTRSTRRLRAVLGADFLRDGMSHAGLTEATKDFWEAVEATVEEDSELFIMTSDRMSVPIHSPATWVCSNGREWQGLLPVLERLPEAAVADRLAELEHRLRRWYQPSPAHGYKAFSWVASPRQQPPSSASLLDTSGKDPVPAHSLADDIIITIRQGLSDGTFASDDEISDRSLSRRLGVSRGRVQRALQSLAEDGLVTATTGTAVVVRLPTVADVMETYAARRALGAIAVRAATRWGPEQRATVEQLLDEIRRCADHHDVARAQQVDLDFQDALFKASGLGRIPAMLQSLSKQTLMFISVIGIRYAYSPARIVELDTAIFEGVRDKDSEKATRGWQNKIDEGARYMINQIELLQRGPTGTSTR